MNLLIRMLKPKYLNIDIFIEWWLTQSIKKVTDSGDNERINNDFGSIIEPSLREYKLDIAFNEIC